MAANSYWVSFLRLCLRLLNLVVAAAGLAMIFWAAHMYLEVKHPGLPPSDADTQLVFGLIAVSAKASSLWFIWAFGGAGLFMFLTALVGFVGVSANSPRWLGLYSVLLGVLLLAQGLLGVAFFADDALRKRLPPDPTGEAEEIDEYLHKKLAICKWVALGALILQGLLLFVAYHLSMAQLVELNEASDEEDREWGRRPLLQEAPRAAAGSTPREGDRTGPSRRADVWSTRMRQKYELDVLDGPLALSPDGRRLPPANSPERAPLQQKRRYCLVM